MTKFVFIDSHVNLSCIKMGNSCKFKFQFEPQNFETFLLVILIIDYLNLLTRVNSHDWTFIPLSPSQQFCCIICYSI